MGQIIKRARRWIVASLWSKHHMRASDASFFNEMVDNEYRGDRRFDGSEGLKLKEWRRQDFPNGDKVT
jgi:hypothetical protein